MADFDWNAYEIESPETEVVEQAASAPAFNWDEQEIETPSDIGMGESALRGSEQGLTLNFADEIGSAIGAGLEGVSQAWTQGSLAPLSDQNLMREYEDYLNWNRERYKQAEAANPKTFLAGEIAGSTLLPAGTLGKGATMADKIRHGALVGGALSGTAAAGASEADIGSQDFNRDVLFGTAGGVIGGAVAPPLISGTKAVADEVAGGARWLGGKILGPTTEAFDLGLKGIKAGSEAGQEAVTKNVSDFAAKPASFVKENLEEYAKLKNDLISEAQAMGIQLDAKKIDNMINARVGQVSKSNLPEVQAELGKLQELLLTAQKGALVKTPTGQIVRAGSKNLSNPEEAYQLYKDLKQISQFGDKGLGSQEARKATGQTIQELQAILRDPQSGIAHLTNVDQKINSLNKAAEALGIKDTFDINEPQIREKIISLLGQEGKVTVGGIKAEQRIDDFLNELEKVNKRAADQFREEFPKYGEQLQVLQEVNKPLGTLFSLPRKLSTTGANVAGYYVGAAGRAAKTIGESGVAPIRDMSPDWLKNTAAKLAQQASPAAQELSNLLVKAADSEERARNAILFGLMQNPAYRQMMKEDEAPK